jgi:hypothetical protein
VAVRHPPIEPKLLASFETRPDEDYLNLVAVAIADEARATKCEHIRLQDALLILVFERWERGIINNDERDRLIKRLYT